MLQSIMDDYEKGEEITRENLDLIRVEKEEEEESAGDHFDFRKAKVRGFRHRRYIAEPYVATVGWYAFARSGRSGARKEPDAVGEDEENAYECMVLTKITNLVSESGDVTEKKFSINIPVGIVPMLNVVFSYLAERLEE